MRVAVVLYDQFTALDAVGPYEVLSRVPGAEVTFVAAQAGPVRTDTDRLALVADAALDELPDPDVILIPGGPGQLALMEDEPLLSWLRRADASSTWTTSVCTGSLLLAAAGLLDGRRATTHWLLLDDLERHGATAVRERVVVDGKVVTAAGVSAGIDMALTLAAELAGADVAQTAQLLLEYDPKPPFDAGSPATAPDALVAALREASRQLLAASDVQRA
ncbi:DJ-1/PfpI family protein [Conexibacter arvalis]|uniref:Putative intracellular protease/amidase n=1 Tax=Conexibacter arvalis TaxID=912552 RepID=A0A840IA93_9ACTN|nr:DJ-1/PfpI family protein [Conexibacter arvalis]MBB4661275.1 putative intracellular protease/amidase [Conexibacter arvalis]